MNRFGLPDECKITESTLSALTPEQKAMRELLRLFMVLITDRDERREACDVIDAFLYDAQRSR